MSVVVTGLGLVTVLGQDVATTWRRLSAGASFVRKPIAGLPEQQRPPLLALMAAREALDDSQLLVPQAQMAVVFGTSRGQMADIEAINHDHDYGRWLASQPSQGALAIADWLQTLHLASVPAVACASGAWAVGWGMRLIEWGYQQRVLCGASEGWLSPLGCVGFKQMGILAPEALRPFDRERQGLIPTEGAAALILEEESAAKARGATIYGRITGFAQTNDAFHPCRPAPTDQQAARAIALCLAEMGITAAEVDYVNAHGTGTPLNDAREGALIQKIYPNSVAIGATKGATGHALGATAAIEAVFCLLALHHQYLPPCPGLVKPELDLNFIRSGRSARLTHAISHSFAFGGQNVVLGFQSKDN